MKKIDNTSFRCTACGGAVHTRIARPATTYAARGEYSIAVCNSCGMGSTSPRPAPETLASIYERTYRYDAHQLIAHEKRWRSRRLLREAIAPGRSSVLDIGCMYGYLMEAANAVGIERVQGVELSPSASAIARQHGFDVFTGSVEQFGVLPHEPFDLVVAQHVMEHVYDLSDFVESISQLMTKTGRLCLCVPNFGGRIRHLTGESWGWYQVPVHLHHFTRESLGLLLNRHGLAVERSYVRGGDTVFVVLTLLNLLRRAMTPGGAAPSALQSRVLRVAEVILRPYYRFADDELILIARKSL